MKKIIISILVLAASFFISFKITENRAASFIVDCTPEYLKTLLSGKKNYSSFTPEERKLYSDTMSCIESKQTLVERFITNQFMNQMFQGE